MRPQPNAVYTTAQILQLLELSDTPHLRFYCAEYDEIAVVQTGHVTYEQLLAVPGFADLKWTYQYTTREDIPRAALGRGYQLHASFKEMIYYRGAIVTKKGQ